ncbi:Transcriptional regulator, AraC family [Stigmatella aurantiaca DW4/3-1]|uniref:Transcriptional regulator, AraC family n=1 Tax=Stigmatella aurantiaca (strain DW4/3-1) TaxID=378806 RepID=Q094F9_STIAD|nr:hypothetical protein [Stigmatella aurantiaca]ADO68167.1 Transcriptional regulator, AraC family [Stigmatella aurantiaca DW4/3-1]EAU67100.1 transcriptional regulator, AraC family [Stigmatella aurantiaca DW4/3-1]
MKEIHYRLLTAPFGRTLRHLVRLLEARRRLLTGAASVSTAAYESPNQFSREYARKFGVPSRKEFTNAATSRVSAT